MKRNLSYIAIGSVPFLVAGVISLCIILANSYPPIGIALGIAALIGLCWFIGWAISDLRRAWRRIGEPERPLPRPQPSMPAEERRSLGGTSGTKPPPPPPPDRG